MLMNPYLPLPLRVRDIVYETSDKMIKTFRLEFVENRFNYRCGQFAEIFIPGYGEAPFGMASSPMSEILEFTVSRAGVLTSAMHDLEPGQQIGVRGPLGNGFPIEQIEGKNLLLIGGGFGFTTLRSLTQYILHVNNRQRFGAITIVYGARTPDLFLYKNELAIWEKCPDICLHQTIDCEISGWDKLVGFVPDVIRKIDPKPNNSTALVCGPPAMIKHTLPVLQNLGFATEQIFLSLEMKMKCGIGQCGRCNIGHKYTCKDGPVFSLAELSVLPQEYLI